MNTEYANLFTIYGFSPVPEDLLEECKLNPLLNPIAYKSLGMGLVQIVANLPKKKNKYFRFEVGGPSAEEYEDNQRRMKRLREKNALSWSDLVKKL